MLSSGRVSVLFNNSVLHDGGTSIDKLISNLKKKREEIYAGIIGEASFKEVGSKVGEDFTELASNFASAILTINNVQDFLVSTAKNSYESNKLPQEVAHQFVDLWSKGQSIQSLFVESINDALDGTYSKNLAAFKGKLAVLKIALRELLHQEFFYLGKYLSFQEFSALADWSLALLA